MKFLNTLLFCGFAFVGTAQISESLVPKDAVSVFTINNINLFQKISLDELISYEFMEEIQQELFDGSTAGKTIKDTGFDFNQKFNVFFGSGDDFEISGFTFGVENKELLFEVFDDFEKVESDYPGIEFYTSYFNQIAIKGTSGILYRVTPNDRLINETTDSIWYANGNEYPWFNYYNYYFEEEIEAVEQFPDEMETENNTSNPIENDELPIADENPIEKNYYECRDSVEVVFQQKFLKQFNDELFLQGDNLLTSDQRFADQLKKNVEGNFYIDNSKIMRRNYDFNYMRTIYPSLYNDVTQLYSSSVIVGDLVINDNSIEMHMDTKYGDQLGSIYEKLTDTKFDKNFFKYIHQDNKGFFTYKVNLRAAYEQAYDVILPILERESENSTDISMSLLTMEFMDEFLNKDAIFDTYKGGMFGSFNGIQKVKTKKVIFEYDEDTFEYTEEIVEAEEDMPIFTLGFSTDRSDLLERFVNRITKISSSWKQEGNYISIENGMLNAAPLFLIVKNGLFIVTNDSDLAMNHSNGYGGNSIDKKTQKTVLKSGVLYAYSDLGKAMEGLPRNLFSERENNIIDVTRGKTGSLEFSSTQTSTNNTSFNLTYNFEGEYDASSTYILDLINSLYVITK
jgi:hypothetical protein